MFASTALNYMDRQAITLVRPQIMREFGLSSLAEFGWVVTAFQLTYAIVQVPAGLLVDRWDVRRTYAAAVAWWSLAGIAAAFSPSLGFLMVCRILLGFGESFNWPCALQVTGRILPPSDRSLGNGIFNSGAAVGAVITPLLVPPLTDRFGWRVAFVVVGVLGFVWVLVWLPVVGRRREPFAALDSGSNRRSSPSEEGRSQAAGMSSTAKGAFAGLTVLSLAMASLAFGYGLAWVWWGFALLMVGVLLIPLALPRDRLGDGWAGSLGEVVRLPRFWILVVVSVSINICWHFQVVWLPTYLKEDRGMSYLASGMLTALPFLAADAGNLGGGALARWLVGRGVPVNRSRRLVMAGCAALITGGIWVDSTENNTLVVILLGLMALGTAAFMANYFAFTQDVSVRQTGLVVGILGGLGNLFAAGFHPLAGWIADTTGSFATVFMLIGLLPLLGLVAITWGWGDAPAAAFRGPASLPDPDGPAA
jgi:ACS family hexuronate transporter-like MFS transporter